LSFLTSLSNWYVRANRKRGKGGLGQTEMKNCLATLWNVLDALCRLMAPFSPFLVELMYQNLKLALPPDKRVDSVHYLDIPTKDDAAVNPRVQLAVDRMRRVVELGRTARDARNLSLKHPLRTVTVVHTDEKFLADIKSLTDYVREELNVQSVALSSSVDKFVMFHAEPNARALGKRFGAKIKQLEAPIRALTHEQLTGFKKNGHVTAGGEKIVIGEINVLIAFHGDKTKLEHATDDDGQLLVVLDVAPDPQLAEQGQAREFVNRVQRLRKKASLTPSEPVDVFYRVTAGVKTHADPTANAPSLAKVVPAQDKYIADVLRQRVQEASTRPAAALSIVSESFQVGSETLHIEITKPISSPKAN